MFLCGMFCLPFGEASSSQRHGVRKHAAKQEQETPAPAQPAPPPGPLTQFSLMQLPANPPVVEYQNGALSIVAQNSTLGDILRAVRAKTGAAIDVPPSANERVVSRFGPGPARQVLAELLDGSHFNYIMMGSATDANAVATVILTPKPASTPETAAQNQPDATQMSQRRTGFGPNAQALNNSDDDADEDSDMNPSEQAASPASNANDQQQPNSGQPQIKTPEQLLQELQQQQRQLQQRQQGQDAPPGAVEQPGPPSR